MMSHIDNVFVEDILEGFSFKSFESLEDLEVRYFTPNFCTPDKKN